MSFTLNPKRLAVEQNNVVRYQRRIHYVDKTLQKWLLTGLVLMEVTLAAGLAWLMYTHLSQVVEDNLYVIHMAQAKPLSTELLQASLQVFGLFVVVNVVALVLVDVLWRRHVDLILREFGGLIGKTAALDMSADAAMQCQHALLDLTQAQRAQDRARLTAVHDHVAQLANAQEAGDAAAVQQALQALDQIIPAGRAARPERRQALRMA